MDMLALTRIFTALIIVIALMLLATWIARRKGLLPRRNHGTALSVTNRINVGARGIQIMVVEVEDTRLVVGVTRGSITVLHTLGPRPDPESSLSSEAAAPSFRHLLGSLTRPR